LAPDSSFPTALFTFSHLTTRLSISSLIILDSAVLLETSPILSTWSWYASTYQQYHTIIHFLIEMHENPNLAGAERIGLMIDHVFGASYGQTRSERVFDLLCLLRDSLAGYLKLRGVKTTDTEATRASESTQKSISTESRIASSSGNTSLDSAETLNIRMSEWVARADDMSGDPLYLSIPGFMLDP
jgi:hypothetical protein